MPAIDLGRFDVLTFDCYGTLIDWETGLLAALRPVLARARRDRGRRRAAGALRALRGGARGGRRTCRYREVVGAVRCHAVGTTLGFEADPAERAAFGASVGDWPAVPGLGEAALGAAPRYRFAP